MNKILSPLSFTRGPVMKNRFMLAPLTNSQSHEDGVMSEEEFKWLTMRAKGGFGLTMTCASHVQAIGKGFPGQMGVFSDDHLEGLTRLATEINDQDSISIVQLHHAGMRSPKELIGEDPSREGLINTPKRVAKAWDFLTKGYTKNLDELINNAIFEGESKDMVIVKNIEFYSLCEHHMIPFYGKAHIGYIPDGKIIGLSKLARITDLFSQRLQVQERLTNQIAQCLQEVLNPRGVAVVLEGKHFCMLSRGVQKQNSIATSSSMLGIFREKVSTRNEFLKLIEMNNI